MTEGSPILMTWTGDNMVPCGPYWAKRADAQWVVGERYLVEVKHERSQSQHRMYFASVNQIWQNLPDHLSEKFKNPDALRRAALIKCGYCDQRSIVARSKAEAERMAAFMAPLDPYSVIAVENATIVILTARSQSHKSMGAAQFKQSMDRTLDYLASLIETTKDKLAENAREVA
jgi:hypothetical protein